MQLGLHPCRAAGTTRDGTAASRNRTHGSSRATPTVLGEGGGAHLPIRGGFGDYPPSALLGPLAALGDQAWGDGLALMGRTSLPLSAAGKQQAQPVVLEVAEAMATRFTFFTK